MDFFGYDWELPLWDMELVRFFERMPNDLKFEQRLYRLWLKQWNYKGLFYNFNPTVWSWPGLSLATLPVGSLIEFLLGPASRKRWLEKMSYWGHTREHMAPYSFLEYLNVCHDIRNCIALNGRTWARENKLPANIVDIGQERSPDSTRK